MADEGDTALPHAKVEVKDFYKHIESESLPEPKRMRQLLTWCATRALTEKQMGAAFEDVSAMQAGKSFSEESHVELTLSQLVSYKKSS